MRLILLLILMTSLWGCESAYYNAMEKVGIHKRDILVDRVDEAKESQADAQVEFQDALSQFRSVVNFQGGDLEALYSRLNSEYEDSVAAAEEIRERINKVEEVAEALFDEWDEELELYSNARLRSESKSKLAATKRRYASLISSMRTAEESMTPVLSSLQDNVLYLKHNLNASAVGALKGELNNIDRDVSSLLRAMSAAIQESDAFIEQLR